MSSLDRRTFLATVTTGGLASQLPAGLKAAEPAAKTSPAAPTGRIDAATLEAGEKLAGISYTPDQRAKLVKGVADRAAQLPTLRAKPIPYDLPPATGFDPRLAGITPPAGPATRLSPAAFTVAARATPQRPTDPDDLAFLSVVELSALLRARRITSRELTELCLARLKRYDPVLQAVVTLLPERALQQADAADAEIGAGRWRGPLHGVPWGAKDLFAVRGYPTTWGAAPFKDRVIDDDAEVVRRLDAAGAVLVAKLSVGALANGDNWFGGQTRCPWNPALGSSGSSAGSCASVSAGLIPFALGSETLGSIVSPCTRNAVTGLRPTYGRVSRAGAMALSWSMDKIGPIARTAEDCALIFDAIHGADPRDPSSISVPLSWQPTASLLGQRIGYLATQFELTNEWHATNQATLETLRRLGAELVPITLPAAPLDAMRVVLTVEAAAVFDDLTRSGELDNLIAPRPTNWPSLREVRFIPAVEYLQATRLRTQLVRDLEQTLIEAGVDVWASLPGGQHLTMTNLTGHPTVCVPTGFQPVPNQPPSGRRLTAGASFNARLYRDDRALAVAHAFQQATDWHRRRPPIA